MQGSEEIIPVLNVLIESALARGTYIVVSRDWHPRNHISFRNRGGEWPEHCVQDTAGAAFHPELRLPSGVAVISKGMHHDRDNYSAFDGTGLANLLRRSGVQRIWIAGLAQEVCVQATALDGLKEGFEVHIIKDATRPVDPKSGTRAIEEMSAAGCIIESTTYDAGRPVASPSGAVSFGDMSHGRAKNEGCSS